MIAKAREKSSEAPALRAHSSIIVSVGNILDSADVRSTGALEPPDFFVTEMQRVRGGRSHSFLTTPLGVFARVLDSALVYEGR